MRVRILVAIAVLGAVLTGAVACGGSKNKTIANGEQIANSSLTASGSITVAGSATANGSTTATASVPPSATVSSSTVKEFGDPPVLGANITAVAPAYAQSVTQNATRTTNANNPSGVCADITFDPPVQSFQWFRMAVDNTEVTTKLTLIAHDTSSNATPVVGNNATICYSPAEGLPVGVHSAAVSVQEPNAPTKDPVQTVAWKFKVTN